MSLAGLWDLDIAGKCSLATWRATPLYLLHVLLSVLTTCLLLTTHLERVGARLGLALSLGFLLLGAHLDRVRGRVRVKVRVRVGVRARVRARARARARVRVGWG